MARQISFTLNLSQTTTLLMRHALQKRVTTYQKILLIRLCALFLTTKAFDQIVRSLVMSHLVQHMRRTKPLLHTWRSIAVSTTKVGTLFASVGSRNKLLPELSLQTPCCRLATLAYSHGTNCQKTNSALLRVCKKHSQRSLTTQMIRLAALLKGCAKSVNSTTQFSLFMLITALHKRVARTESCTK